MPGLDQYFAGVLVKAALTGIGIGALIVMGFGLVIWWNLA
jgi:hypothetical protein